MPKKLLGYICHTDIRRSFLLYKKLSDREHNDVAKVPAVCRGTSLKIKFSNCLLAAVLQALPAVCRGIRLKKHFQTAYCPDDGKA